MSSAWQEARDLRLKGDGFQLPFKVGALVWFARSGFEQALECWCSAPLGTHTVSALNSMSSSSDWNFKFFIQIVLKFKTPGFVHVFLLYFCASRFNLIVVRYTSYSEPLCTQSRKPFPGTFLPENLENFSQKNFFFFSIFELSIKSWKLVPPTNPPPSPLWQMGILDFSKFELSIKFCEPPPPPPPMGILDFSKFERSIKFREPPLPTNGILDFSKFELSIKFCETAPPPPQQMGILDFSKFELSIKFREPPLPQQMGILDFSKFECA